MKRKEESRLRELFATKIGGPMYKLFYKGKFCQLKDGGEVLLSKHAVMESLGVDYDSLPYSDRAFVNMLWNLAIRRFRQRAWDIGQPWGTIRATHSNGETIWLHGYTFDPAKQEAMKAQKHSSAIDVYRSEQRQVMAFNQAMGDNVQIELIPRSESTSFLIED